MYTFSIEKENIPLLRVTTVGVLVENDTYLSDLIERCFERVFTLIKEAKKEKERDSSKEANLEDED